MKNILIFSKYPSPGDVKTRLALNTCLNYDDTSQLAKAMLSDTIALSYQSRTDNIIIGYSPESMKLQFESLVNEIIEIEKKEDLNPNILFFPQSGEDFDERFTSVTRHAYKNGNIPLVILGADLPLIPESIINHAFEHLSGPDNKRNIVLGPSSGGGIYLVGISYDFNPNWFHQYNLFRGGIEISQFIKFCEKKDFNLILLPPMGDVDIEEDLVSLIMYISGLKHSKKNIGYHFPKYTSDIIDQLNLSVITEKNKNRKRTLKKEE